MSINDKELVLFALWVFMLLFLTVGLSIKIAGFDQECVLHFITLIFFLYGSWRVSDPRAEQSNIIVLCIAVFTITLIYVSGGGLW